MRRDGKRNGLFGRLTIFYGKSYVGSHLLIKAASTSAKAWWCPSHYPKPARHQLTLSTIRQRNQGRCKLLRRNSAAAMSSLGDSSEVRRSFRVSTGRRTISSSEVNRRVPAAYRGEFRRTVCMATQQPGLINLVDYAVWGALQQSMHRKGVYLKSHSSFQPGRSRGQSAHLLGESWPTDHQQVHWSVARQPEGSSSNERWIHWIVVLNIWFICCVMLCFVA